MIRIKNKRGDLKEEMPGVIIAVLGLILIGLVAYKIYDAAVSQEEKSAKRLADLVEEKINIVSEGEARKFTFQGFGEDRAWYICGWGKEQTKIPEKCFPDSCVCVCPKIDYTPGERCQEKGFCRKFEFENIEVEPANLFGFVEGPGKDISFSGERCIGILNNLFELEVKKTKDAINIEYVA